MSALVTVYESSDLALFAMAKAALDGAGIRYVAQGEGIQDLFGMGFRSYQGPTAPTLAIGPTVQFVMMTGGGGGARAGAPPAPPRPASINHACMSLDGFNPDQVLKTLETYGITPRGDATGPVGPMKSYVTMRMENRGGEPGGTPELYFTDPDGLLMQLQDSSYCGGNGVLGNVCK